MKNFQLNIYWCLISFSGWCRSRTGYRWTDRRRPIAEPLLRLRPFLLGLRLQTVAIVRHQRYQEPRKASLKTTSTTENETICFCGAENWKKTNLLVKNKQKFIFSFSHRFSQSKVEFDYESCHSFQSTIFQNLGPSQLTISYHYKLW